MMIFLSLRVTADAEGGLKIRAQLRPDLQGFGGGQPPTSEPRYIPRHCLPLPLRSILHQLYNTCLLIFT